jgi:hypothetical protein
MFATDYFDPSDLGMNPAFQSEQGHLRCDAIITRVGVLRYFDPETNEYINVLRHPDQVFDADSVATFGGLPITVNHPQDEDGNYIMVNPANFDRYGVGTVGDNLVVANPYVKVTGLNIQSQRGLDALINGNKQLSPGYWMERIPEDGVYDSVPYTHRQYGIDNGNGKQIIIGNHLAIMGTGQQGRSGKTVKVYGLDSADQPSLHPVITQVAYDFSNDKTSKIFDLKPNQRSRKMTKTIELKLPRKNVKYAFTVDDDDMMAMPSPDFATIATVIEQADTLLDQIMQMLGIPDPDGIVDAISNLKASTVKPDTPTEDPAMQAENEALKTQADELENNNKAMVGEMDSLRSEVAKYKLIGELTDILPVGFSVDSVDVKTLKTQIVKQWNAEIAIDSDVALDAIYPIAVKALKSKKETLEAVGSTITKAVNVAVDVSDRRPSGIKVHGLSELQKQRLAK